jgi:hypothetical protein
MIFPKMPSGLKMSAVGGGRYFSMSSCLSPRSGVGDCGAVGGSGTTATSVGALAGQEIAQEVVLGLLLGFCDRFRQLLRFSKNKASISRTPAPDGRGCRAGGWKKG